MPLYEVAIISKPSKNDLDNGVSAKLVLPPTAVVADDERTAVAKATKGVEIGNGEILVRLFNTFNTPYYVTYGNQATTTCSATSTTSGASS